MKTKISKRDYKYVPKDAEKGFSAEKNQRIINEVIEETDKIRLKKRKEYSKALEERTDAVSEYLHNLSQGGRTSDISKYFGRKYMAHLRGQEILAKIQKDLEVVKNGQVIKRRGD